MSRIIKSALIAGFVILLFIISSIEDPERRPGRRITKCKNCLKQNLAMVQLYFADHPEVRRFPAGREVRGKISPASVAYWDFDQSMLVCPVRRDDPQPVRDYEWNPALAGGIYADWTKPESPILCDVTPHHFALSPWWSFSEFRAYNVIFGDGHVEEAKNKPW